MVNSWPKNIEVEEVVAEFEQYKKLISEIRNIRKNKNISFKEQLELKVIAASNSSKRYDKVVSKLTNLKSIEYVTEKVENSLSFVLGANEYFIPFEEEVDLEAEKAKLNEEIAYQKGFLNSVEKKLSNSRFVDNAPEQVVAIEKKKQAEAQAKIEVLKKQLASL